MRYLTSLVLLLLVSSCYAQTLPGNVTGDTKAHDPSLCKDASGKYFLFSTGKGIGIRTSTNRTLWTFEGLVFPDGAPWTDEYTGTSNGDLWAPDCTIVGGRFYLYYSASTYGTQRSAIFLAVSDTGLPGSFKHVGLITSTTDGDDHNAIDPNLFIDGDTWYLSFGSFWTGIKGFNVKPLEGTRSGDELYSLATRAPGTTAIEAPYIFKFGRFYYLFTSWGQCCEGTDSTYNIRVGRSTDLRRGYVDADGVPLTKGGGTLVLAAHDYVHGPGGQEVYLDDDGPIIIYHYYATDGVHLGINRLNFSSGWPVVV